MAIPKIQEIRNESYVLWGKKCACGHRVRVGHNVMSKKLPDGSMFIEHVDCLLDHLNGEGRGLRQPNPDFFWVGCTLGAECKDLFSEQVSYWRSSDWTFGIHKACLEHLLRGWERSSVPILQKDIDSQLAQLTGPPRL